jgi:hypothetical protein
MLQETDEMYVRVYRESLAMDEESDHEDGKISYHVGSEVPGVARVIG